MKLTAFLLLVAPILAIGQSQDSVQHLIGVWRIADSHLNAAAQSRMNKLKKDNPAAADAVSLEALASMMKATTLEFKQDGGITITNPQGGTSDGKWALTNSNKVIEYTTSLSGPQRRDILRIAKGKFVWKLEDGTVVQYVPK